MTHRFPARRRFYQHDPSGPHTSRAVIDHVLLDASYQSNGIQFLATAYDVHGRVVTGVGSDWRSSNTAIAPVTSSGLASFAVVGSPVTFTATVDGRDYTIQSTGVPTTPVALVAALNEVGAGVALDLWIDGNSTTPSVAAIGQATLTSAVDGTATDGKRVTRWASAFGSGHDWLPSADVNSGAGPNSDGTTVSGPGIELPAAGNTYTGGGLIHGEDTSATTYISGVNVGSGTSQLQNLFFDDREAGMQWIIVGRLLYNSGIFDFGEDGDTNYRAHSADALSNLQAILDDPKLITWDDNTTARASRARGLVAFWHNPTTSYGIFDSVRYGRDLVAPNGGSGIHDGTTPNFAANQRVRLFRASAWSANHVGEANMIIPVRGQLDKVQWKLLCDTVQAWYPDITWDARPNYVAFSGDSVPATVWAQTSRPALELLVNGTDGAPALPTCTLVTCPQAGNTNQKFQFPFIRLMAEGDFSLRTRAGLCFFEALNDQSELVTNYYVGDFWRELGTKFKSVLHAFLTYSNYQNIVGNTDLAQLIANAPAHCDQFVDDMTNNVGLSAWNFGDGHDAGEAGHAYPAGENPYLWGAWHPTLIYLAYWRQWLREMLRYLCGGDPTGNPVIGVPTVDHVLLSAATPTSNPAITDTLNWLNTSLGTAGQTWAHSMIILSGGVEADGSAIATVDADGTVHRVTSGHVMRKSISSKGAWCLVDFNIS